MEVASYTYVNLETATGNVWAAVPQAPVTVGATVTVDNAMLMINFRSQSLNRTFPEIYFGVLRGAAGAATGPAAPVADAVPAPTAANVRVAKAGGPNAFTVSEVFSQAQELAERSVTVRATVVKVNNGIMDRNWLHVRDGSGSEADGTDDLVVTTAETASVGDVVTVSGRLVTDKDFGAGYAYKVLVENATLTGK